MSLCSDCDRFTLHKFGDAGYNSYSINLFEEVMEAGCEFCTPVFQALKIPYIDQRKSEFSNGFYVHLAAINNRNPIHTERSKANGSNRHAGIRDTVYSLPCFSSSWVCSGLRVLTDGAVK